MNIFLNLIDLNNSISFFGLKETGNNFFENSKIDLEETVKDK